MEAKTANWAMDGEYAVVAYALEHLEKTLRKTLLVASTLVLNHSLLQGEIKHRPYSTNSKFNCLQIYCLATSSFAWLMQKNRLYLS